MLEHKYLIAIESFSTAMYSSRNISFQSNAIIDQVSGCDKRGVINDYIGNPYKRQYIYEKYGATPDHIRAIKISDESIEYSLINIIKKLTNMENKDIEGFINIFKAFPSFEFKLKENYEDFAKEQINHFVEYCKNLVIDYAKEKELLSLEKTQKLDEVLSEMFFIKDEDIEDSTYKKTLKNFQSYIKENTKNNLENIIFKFEEEDKE